MAIEIYTIDFIADNSQKIYFCFIEPLNPKTLEALTAIYNKLGDRDDCFIPDFEDEFYSDLIRSNFQGNLLSLSTLYSLTIDLDSSIGEVARRSNLLGEIFLAIKTHNPVVLIKKIHATVAV